MQFVSPKQSPHGRNDYERCQNRTRSSYELRSNQSMELRYSAFDGLLLLFGVLTVFDVCPWCNQSIADHRTIRSRNECDDNGM